MSFGGATLPRRCLAHALSCVALLGSPLVAHATAQSAIALHSVTVEERGGTYVVTLSADGPIESRLHRLPGSPARIYLDLAGVVPRVAAHTAVDRGPILRIRVGINSAEPLVTRVVIDLASELPSRLERDTDGQQIRVVMGADAISAEPVRTKRPPAAAADAAWCREFAGRAEDMLVAPAAATPAAAMVIDAQWAALEADATARTPAQPVERVHSMLVQAVRLARIAVSGTQHPDQAAAARSGARLLLESARAQLAAMP